MNRYTAGLVLDITAGEDVDRVVQLFSDTTQTKKIDGGQFTSFFGALKTSFDDATELFQLILTPSLIDGTGSSVPTTEGFYRFQALRTGTLAINALAKASPGDVILMAPFDCWGIGVSGAHTLLCRGVGRLHPSVTTESKPA